MYYKVIRNSSCKNCGFCSAINRYLNAECVGCLSCYYACPYEARRIIEDKSIRRFEDLLIKVNY